jgi:hypothetical protein
MVRQRIDFFSFLTSLASVGVMSWPGVVVVEGVSGGIVSIAGSLWARGTSEGSGSFLRLRPVNLLMV